MSISTKLFCLLLICILPGCQAFPSAKVDYHALGKSKIADIIIAHWQIAPERTLQPELEKALQQHAGGAALTLETAQQFGFRCEQHLLSCAYRGSLSYQLSDVPAENRAQAKKQIAFDIQLITLQPITVRVQIKR